MALKGFDFAEAPFSRQILHSNNKTFRGILVLITKGTLHRGARLSPLAKLYDNVGLLRIFFFCSWLARTKVQPAPFYGGKAAFGFQRSGHLGYA